mmetsp:Transcript_42936/g.103439  ORF Transcript_42936/g.103439 Transcript_42936/m.103439 type:complete len:200 (-) Transcript_42936:577-1176(-)
MLLQSQRRRFYERILCGSWFGLLHRAAMRLILRGAMMNGPVLCCVVIGTRHSGRVASSSLIITSTGCCGPSADCSQHFLHGHRWTTTRFSVSPRTQRTVRSSAHTGRNALFFTLTRVVTSKNSKNCRMLTQLCGKRERQPSKPGRRRPRPLVQSQRHKRPRRSQRLSSRDRVTRPMRSLLVLSQPSVMLRRKKWKQRER